MRTRNVIIVAVIAIIATLAIAYFFWGRNQKSDTPTTPTATTQVQPNSPCDKIPALKAELANKIQELKQVIADKEAIQTELNDAIDQCRGPLKHGDTLNIRIIKDGKNASGKRARTTNSSSTERSPQSSSSEYRASEKPSVETSVTGGSIAKDLICFNVRDMDGSSFWPALAIDNGVKIAGAVINGSLDGWNISIFPVDEISGLYGTTTSGIIFVRADLIDQFGPTTIRTSGSPNGWKSWVEMQRNGDYYITPPLRNR